jgi:hypothetical protein
MNYLYNIAEGLDPGGLDPRGDTTLLIVSLLIVNF